MYSAQDVPHDVHSSAALEALHRALQQMCKGSFRWTSTKPGLPLERLHACLLRRIVTVLSRVASALAAKGSHHHASAAPLIGVNNSVTGDISATVFTDVDEFKVFMWDNLSTAFVNDQALADTVADLVGDRGALEDLVHSAINDSNAVGGFSSHSMAVSPPEMLAAHTSRQRTTFSPFLSSTTSTTPPEDPQQQQQHPTMGVSPFALNMSSSLLDRKHRSGASQVPSKGGDREKKGSPHGGGGGGGSGARVRSRQALLAMLLLLVFVSMSSSLQSWKSLKHSDAVGDAAVAAGAQRKSGALGRRAVSDDVIKDASVDGDPELVVDMPVSPKFVLEHTQRPSMPPLVAARLPEPRNGHKKPQAFQGKLRVDGRPPSAVDLRRMYELQTVKKMREDAVQAAVNAASQLPKATPIPVTPNPALADDPVGPLPVCGADSVQHPSALPGSSYDPVDSVVALSFDLSVQESASLDRLEAQGLATRHTFVRDLVARAMDANSKDGNSPYHRFFSERNARMEVANVKDTIGPSPLFRSNTTIASTGNQGDSVVFRRRHLPSGEAPGQCPLDVVQPVLVDVVYTYVNPNSPSHKAAMQAECKSHGKECSEHRFRDFNELQHSLRSVYHRAIKQPAANTTNSDARGVSASAGRFVGNVYLVVAHRDQIPDWLMHEPVAAPSHDGSPIADGGDDGGVASDNARPRVFSVTHEDIFPPSVRPTALPTFNSYAIESNLHRIPGVRRFFVYFNNDMLWGRQISFFDYFRPISHARQRHRIRTTLEGQCFAEHFRRAVETQAEPAAATSPFEIIVGTEEDEHHDSSKSRGAGDSEAMPPPRRRRAVVFMEPIYYFEKLDDPADRRMNPRYPTNNAPGPAVGGVGARIARNIRGSVLPSRPPTPAPPPHQASLVSNDEDVGGRDEGGGTNTSLCARMPIKASAIFALQMKNPRPNDALHKVTNYNRRLLFEHYGLPPSHSFAHYPGIYDRDVLSRLLEYELPEQAKSTRAARFRGEHNLWVTMVYPFVAFAHRRAVDRRLVSQTLQLWNRTTAYAELVSSATKLGPLMDPLFGALPERYQGDMWLSKEASVASQLTPLSDVFGTTGHRVVKEKLRDWLVAMDGKEEAMYHFCMMTTSAMINRYQRELEVKMKLFVTANDDLKITNPAAINAVTSLLLLVSAGAAPAPWER